VKEVSDEEMEMENLTSTVGERERVSRKGTEEQRNITRRK
jgi:hypothetical protein